MKDTFKTASFLSGRAAMGLNPSVSYGATRLRRIVNPAFVPTVFAFQGSISGYTSGGLAGPSQNIVSNVIEKFPFASNANSSDVGDLSQARIFVVGQKGISNGYTSGGYAPPPATPTLGTLNTIDKFPFASNANATDVGDLTQKRTQSASQSSTTSGYTCGGDSTSNVIDKFPTGSDANATDVGDLSQGRSTVGGGQSSADNGYTTGGDAPPGSPIYSNVIDKFPFASDANATDVGDLSQRRIQVAGHSSTTAGYTGGGFYTTSPPLRTTGTLDKFPFATNANASLIGALSQSRRNGAGQSSTTSGYTSGGLFRGAVPPTLNTFPTNTIDKFPFATDASASDVGDLIAVVYSAAGQQS